MQEAEWETAEMEFQEMHRLDNQICLAISETMYSRYEPDVGWNLENI
jgi:hypothetical protein